MKRYTYIALTILLLNWVIPGSLTFAQTPYGGIPRTIPGLIQAEDYDLGGEGLGYHEIDASVWTSAYRIDAADVSDCIDDGGGFQVGTFTTGEWLKYTVDITAGTYNLNFRVATPTAGSQVKVYLDDVLLGTISLPQTGSLNIYQTASLSNLAITGGNGKILRLEPVTPTFRINWVEFVSGTAPIAPSALAAQPASATQIDLSWRDNSSNETGFKIERKSGSGSFTTIAMVGANVTTYSNTGLTIGANYTYRVAAYIGSENSTYSNEYALSMVQELPFGGTPRNIPGRIQAEDYDLGGEGVGYHEIDYYNSTSVYRSDAADIKTCSDADGGYMINTMVNGEWRKYTVNVTAGTYNLNIRIATPWAGSRVKVYLDNVWLGTIALPQTGAWSVYQTVSLNNLSIPGGNGKILRLEPSTPDLAFNWIEFASTLPTPPGGLTATSPSADRVNLLWTDNSSNENGFTIERRTGTTGSFTTVATAAANATAYTDNNILPSTTYTYRVAATNGAGTSSYTAEVQVTTSTYTLKPAVAQYNGNISAIQWKSAAAASEEQATDVKEYDYYYDALNRITASQYRNKTHATYTGSYDEGNYTYDANGNLLSLKRSGYKSGVSEVIDNLTYSYGTNNSGNQLNAISDAADKDFGFMDKHPGDNDYAYDSNGNLIKDLNKGIDKITYNILNLPCKIAGGSDSIVYTYDATGVKLGKKVYKAGALTATIDYSGELEFYNHLLKYVHTEEGLVEHNAGSFTYEYFLKDHLGNTRAVVSVDASGNLVIGQATSYYPFGMAFTGTTQSGNAGSDNKYQYNGKELQEETLGGVRLDWLDYGARFYDPAIGRFSTIDKFAEKYNWMNPYQYGANNPIKFIDVNGDSIWYTNNDGKIVYDAKINSQEEFEKAGIEGTYIGQSFVGRDQDDAMFSFNIDGTTEKSDVTATAASKAFGDKETQERFLNSMVNIESTLISDGKSKTSEAAFGAALVAAKKPSVPTYIFAAGAVIVGGIAAINTGHAVYEFARSIDEEADQAHKKARPSTHDKHTKRRPGGDWEKKKDPKKGWKPRK